MPTHLTACHFCFLSLSAQTDCRQADSHCLCEVCSTEASGNPPERHQSKLHDTLDRTLRLRAHFSSGDQVQYEYSAWSILAHAPLYHTCTNCNDTCTIGLFKDV